MPLWSVAWGLGVPAGARRRPRGSAAAVFGAFADHDWIGNSRNRADDDVIRAIAAMAGFEPRIKHRSDSLDIVEEMIVARMGVGLLPADRRIRRGVALLGLSGPDVTWRAFAVHRRGRDAWPPLAVVLDRLKRQRGRR